jgi:hypothetical protein
MTTLQEVLRRLTGHNGGRPEQINWNNHFTRVQRPRHGDSDAYTRVDFRPTFRYSSRPDRDGKHRLTNVRVTVAMNKGQSWYVAGRKTPLLLRHEQGHYNITFLVGRQLCRRLLELEWDSAVLTAVGESSPNQITNRLRTDADELSRNAQTESTRLNRLYDDSARGAKDANGTINPNAQNRWDQIISHSIQNDTGLSLLIEIAGGNPRNW